MAAQLHNTEKTEVLIAARKGLDGKWDRQTGCLANVFMRRSDRMLALGSLLQDPSPQQPCKKKQLAAPRRAAQPAAAVRSSFTSDL